MDTYLVTTNLGDRDTFYEVSRITTDGNMLTIFKNTNILAVYSTGKWDSITRITNNPLHYGKTLIAEQKDRL
jgi:hypothetical protein